MLSKAIIEKCLIRNFYRLNFISNGNAALHDSGALFCSPSDRTEDLSSKEVRVLCTPIFLLIVAAGMCLCACTYLYESGSCCVLQASLELKILPSASLLHGSHPCATTLLLGSFLNGYGQLSLRINMLLCVCLS